MFPFIKNSLKWLDVISTNKNLFLNTFHYSMKSIFAYHKFIKSFSAVFKCCQIFNVIISYDVIYRVATGQGKVREIQCQGKVREFYNLSGKFEIFLKVRET